MILVIYFKYKFTHQPIKINDFNHFFDIFGKNSTIFEKISNDSSVFFNHILHFLNIFIIYDEKNNQILMKNLKNSCLFNILMDHLIFIMLINSFYSNSLIEKFYENLTNFFNILKNSIFNFGQDNNIYIFLMGSFTNNEDLKLKNFWKKINLNIINMKEQYPNYFQQSKIENLFLAILRNLKNDKRNSDIKILKNILVNSIGFIKVFYVNFPSISEEFLKFLFGDLSKGFSKNPSLSIPVFNHIISVKDFHYLIEFDCIFSLIFKRICKTSNLFHIVFLKVFKTIFDWEIGNIHDQINEKDFFSFFCESTLKFDPKNIIFCQKYGNIFKIPKLRNFIDCYLKVFKQKYKKNEEVELFFLKLKSDHNLVLKFFFLIFNLFFIIKEFESYIKIFCSNNTLKQSSILIISFILKLSMKNLTSFDFNQEFFHIFYKFWLDILITIESSQIKKDLFEELIFLDIILKIIRKFNKEFLSIFLSILEKINEMIQKKLLQFFRNFDQNIMYNIILY